MRSLLPALLLMNALARLVRRRRLEPMAEWERLRAAELFASPGLPRATCGERVEPPRRF